MATAPPVLTFGVARRRLAISAEAVAEVVAAPRLTRVPQAPAGLAGLANLRGKVVPVVSLAALLGEASALSAQRLIVLDREQPVALAVDEVTAVRELGAEAPAGLAEAPEDAIRLLDLDPLLVRAFEGLARAPLARAAAQAAPPAEPPPLEAEERVFLTFDLAGQVYALPLAEVREAADLPAQITQLPRGDDTAVGVMRLRGALLPLVSLKALLGLPMDAGPGAAVLVSALGEAAVGLVVDEARAILRVSADHIQPVPSVLNRGAGEARIDALARTQAGIVSILAVERIFSDEAVRRILAEGAGRIEAAHTDKTRDEAMEQFLLFRLGDERYGLPIAAVDEVLALPDRWTRTPRAPAFMAGVMNHRGAVLPLVDQRRRFEVAGETPGRRRRVIVVRLDDLAVGFVVDAVERIFDAAPGALHPAPELIAEGAAVFDRIATLELDGRPVLLIQPRELLDQAERDLVRSLAAGDPPAGAGVS
jgi:purine-binding chemotaxis protein CheW